MGAEKVRLWGTGRCSRQCHAHQLGFFVTSSVVTTLILLKHVVILFLQFKSDNVGHSLVADDLENFCTRLISCTELRHAKNWGLTSPEDRKTKPLVGVKNIPFLFRRDTCKGAFAAHGFELRHPNKATHAE